MSPIWGSVHFCVTFVMNLVKSQVSRWHFQTPIMNNTGMNVPNISKALIWTHIASIKHHLLYVKMILVQNASVKMTFPNSYHEQHLHESPKHLQSPYLDPHGLHQTSHFISQNDHWISHPKPPQFTLWLYIYVVSKWSMYKSKCHDDISRPLSWTILAWMSQTSPNPSSGPTWPLLKHTNDLPKWSMNKAKCQDDISRPLR